MATNVGAALLWALAIINQGLSRFFTKQNDDRRRIDHVLRTPGKSLQLRLCHGRPAQLLKLEQVSGAVQLRDTDFRGTAA